jgi:cytochrome c oxidase subunit III
MATTHHDEPGQGQGDGHGHGHHSPYLHHHFETPVQQFESDKLGMWLFLATEILLFGGLFCAYSVYRHNHPEVFIYAHQFLDRTMGATNTIVLIFSSFTMAWSIRAIQKGQKMLCAALLVITLLCAATFMVVKYFEYGAKIEHGLLWGTRYQPHHEGTHGAEGEHAPAATKDVAATADGTIAVAESTETKQGVVVPVQENPGIGVGHDAPDTQVDVTNVEDATAAAAEHTAETGHAEAAGHSEEHSAAAPDVQVEGTVTPSGTTHAEPLATGSTQVAGTAGPPGVVTTEVPSGYSYPGSLKLEPSKIKPAAVPPAGLAEVHAADAHASGPEPRNVQTFFAIYFAMTGLHGIHVLIGMIVITIMLVYVLRGKYNAEYWTPIDLTGLYWHIVDLIWIFLFPLLYLIA